MCLLICAFLDAVPTSVALTQECRYNAQSMQSGARELHDSSENICARTNVLVSRGERGSILHRLFHVCRHMFIKDCKASCAMAVPLFLARPNVKMLLACNVPRLFIVALYLVSCLESVAAPHLQLKSSFIACRILLVCMSWFAASCNVDEDVCQSHFDVCECFAGVGVTYLHSDQTRTTHACVHVAKAVYAQARQRGFVCGKLDINMDKDCMDLATSTGWLPI